MSRSAKDPKGFILAAVASGAAAVMVGVSYLAVPFLEQGSSAGAAALSVVSVKSGNWSDAEVWSSGKVPGATATATIAPGHTITFDLTSGQVAGVAVSQGATLKFAASKNARLASSANVIINGILVMKPSSPSVAHVLHFSGANENEFVGGGMAPITTDDGLWVMGAGKLNISGSPKTAWTRAAGSVTQGSNSIPLKQAPVGWRAGDDLAVVPTQPPTAGEVSYTGYSYADVKSVSGSTVSLSAATAHAHPEVDDRWTAEVLNLSRNVRIEGRPTGRSHIFIHSTQPQIVNHAELRYLGPRQNGERVLGRYGLHFHMSDDGARGSLVEGTVVRDAGNHAFVAHRANGVTFRSTIAHHVEEPAYWWDRFKPADRPGPPAEVTDKSLSTSHDTTYENCIASDSLLHGSRENSFFLTAGEGNAVRGCVDVGGRSDQEKDHQLAEVSSFGWQENNEGNWKFEDNISHNNQYSGIFNWLNDIEQHHPVTRFTAYYNSQHGVNHGAYLSCFKYIDNYYYGNLRAGLNIAALSWAPDKCGPDSTDNSTLLFSNFVADGAGISEYPVATDDHHGGTSFSGQLRDCTIKGGTKAQVRIGTPGQPNGPADLYDFIDCTIEGNAFEFSDSIKSESMIRVQDDQTAYALRRFDQAGTLMPKWNARRTTVAPFAQPFPFASDLTPPSAPANLTVVRTGTISATLRWDASTDDVAVNGYRVYRGGDIFSIKQAGSTIFEDSAITESGTYSYTVRAVDAGGNLSEVSNAVLVSPGGM